LEQRSAGFAWAASPEGLRFAYGSIHCGKPWNPAWIGMKVIITILWCYIASMVRLQEEKSSLMNRAIRVRWERIRPFAEVPSKVGSQRPFNNEVYPNYDLASCSFAVYFMPFSRFCIWDKKGSYNPGSGYREHRRSFSRSVWSFQRAKHLNYYRPLMHCLHAHYHSSTETWGFHLVISSSFGVSALVFLIIRRFWLSIPSQRPRYTFPSVYGAMLLPQHPSIRAVTWVAGLPDVALLFSTSSLFIFTSCFGGRQNRLSLFDSFIFVATLFKEPALTFPSCWSLMTTRWRNSMRRYL